MPEGDTIFRSARALEKALGGKIVTEFRTELAALAPVHDNAPVTGRAVERVESRGKWLLIHFSGDLILVTHMLMSGSWHIYRQGERWRRGRTHMRVVIANVDFEAVAFDVPVARFYTARSLERHSAIPQLGPDPLQDGFSRNEAAARIAAYPEEEVANVLLNQRAIAGLGNVYKSEVCYLCGVSPFARVRELSAMQIASLVSTAERLLSVNVKDGTGGQIVTYTGARRTRHTSDPGQRLWVYGRCGRECRRCGAIILMRKQGAACRSTYWCPQCQPLPHPDAEPVAEWSTPSRRGKVGC
ncbi:MAG: Fpg/Nei family DNA glycosylase [Acidobacteriaceae bacterium]